MAWLNVYDLDSSRFAVRQGKSRKPTIILIHDAFHTSSHLEQLARELGEANFRVLVPQLPSSSSTSLPNVFEADVQAIYDHSKSETEADRDVVLVLHGYAGLPGPVAAERLNRFALSRPRTGFVAKIVFVAGVVAKEGECFLDVVRPEWLIYQNGLLGVRQPAQVFFHDCPVDKAQAAVSMLRPQIADSFRTRVIAPGWARVPCVYVVCELDQAITRTWQHTSLRKLQETNPQTNIIGVQASHSPFLSRTKDIAALIIRAANAPRG